MEFQIGINDFKKSRLEKLIHLKNHNAALRIT